ncbi:hypothetical protein BJF85_02130 [Saccharomonospora sp. CUA-673]|nr:hypothetical protein BJF85_02130 [Saccharomonospora sp. CUA-673]
MPSKVDASYLQRFKIAPANESYVISVLRFLGLIGEGGELDGGVTGFLYGDESAFRAGLEEALRATYAPLFDEMGDDALDADRDRLTHWFRVVDKTSEVVGKRQASSFLTLAALAGHGELPASRASAGRKSAGRAGQQQAKRSAKKSATLDQVAAPGAYENGSLAEARNHEPSRAAGVGMTVRVEVNLPPGEDAATYDAIFASIRKHLMS